MCIKNTWNYPSFGYLYLLVRSDHAVLMQKTQVNSGFTTLTRKRIIGDEETISRGFIILYFILGKSMYFMYFMMEKRKTFIDTQKFYLCF